MGLNLLKRESYVVIWVILVLIAFTVLMVTLSPPGLDGSKYQSVPIR
jgi:hypothetical protein